MHFFLILDKQEIKKWKNDTMNRGHPYNEKNLAENIYNAMKRIEKFGIEYPEDYYDQLCQKYNLTNVPYPFIVRHVGNPRIIHHFLYKDILKREETILDYGCGTGDAIRQLIRDGYPIDKIHGFDINSGSLNLGADLYLDHDEIKKKVTVSPKFNCKDNIFELVYSGSVIHVIEDKEEFNEYLMNAYRSLKTGGIFFGLTLGLDDSQKERRRRGPPRLMHKTELENAFVNTGFSNIKIIQDKRRETESPDFNLVLFQFSATKP